MKLVPMKKDAVPKPTRTQRASPYRLLLQDFVKGKHEAAKVSGLTSKVNSSATQLRRYTKLDEQPVVVRVAGNDIYLIRK